MEPAKQNSVSPFDEIAIAKSDVTFNALEEREDDNARSGASGEKKRRINLDYRVADVPPIHITLLYGLQVTGKKRKGY